jgi:hypothetical protein
MRLHFQKFSRESYPTRNTRDEAKRAGGAGIAWDQQKEGRNEREENRRSGRKAKCIGKS